MPDIRFTTPLVAMGPKGAWTFIYFPEEASRALGARGRVPVTGTINGFPFRSSAFPTGDGTHQIAVNKSMQAGARAKPGDRVDIVLRVDTAKRTVPVPADLNRALAANKAAQAKFVKMAWSSRKYYVDWVNDAKQPETRKRRIREAVARIVEGKASFGRD